MYAYIAHISVLCKLANTILEYILEPIIWLRVLIEPWYDSRLIVTNLLWQFNVHL